MLNEDQMRKRFHENRAEREAMLARSAPLRDERDKFVQEYEPRIRELNQQIKTIEQEASPSLFDLDREAGMIVRALNGKTG
jgi:hypothetical protein